jgi:hypothetical protein
MQQQRQYVGIDLHRRRSVIVRITEAGEILETVRIDNDPLEFVQAAMAGGPNPEVALEATYGWYWAADLLAAEGATVHLVHPLGLHWDSRRVKNATPPSSPSAWREATCPKPGSRRRSCASFASSSDTAPSSRRCAPPPRPRSTA